MLRHFGPPGVRFFSFEKSCSSLLLSVFFTLSSASRHHHRLFGSTPVIYFLNGGSSPPVDLHRGREWEICPLVLCHIQFHTIRSRNLFDFALRTWSAP